MQDRYSELVRAHRWNVPDDFNIGNSCLRWADDATRVALWCATAQPTTDGKSFVLEPVTYARLADRADRLANVLRGLGVTRKDRVAIVLPQCEATVVAHLAVYRLGAVAMPLSLLFGPDALEYRLSDSEAVAAIVDAGGGAQFANQAGALRKACPALRAVIQVGAASSRTLQWDALLAGASPDFEPIGTRASDPAVLIYTSGTTGAPKGALIPHRALPGNLSGFTLSQNGFPQSQDVFWSPADWAWTGGLMDALLPTLHFGLSIVADDARRNGRFDPLAAFELLERHRVTNAFIFPTALKMMMKAVPDPRARYDLCLRGIMSAGESVGTAVFDWCRDALGVTVNEMFGQTEINYIVGNSHANWPAKPGSIGRPYPGHRVAVLDDAGRVCKPGEVGEIAANRTDIHGDPDPVFFLEYWKNPEATAAKYDDAGWCRTGDLACADEDGDLWYQGRADDMFKAAGYRIGPSEIENCLVKHPAVANAAVVPSPDAERGNVIKAFVVLTPDHTPSAALIEQLRQHVRDKLAPYETPREIEFIDALPMTTTGKVQRRVLREREAERKRGLSNMRIGFFTQDQLETVADLLCDMSIHYNGANASDRSVVRENLAQNILGADSGVRLVVASDPDRAVGLAAISLQYPAPKEKGQLFMKELYVVSDHRDRGIGQAIMRWVARYAIQKNCIRFDWTVEATNPKAIEFYEELGATHVKDKLYFRFCDDQLLKFSLES